jgi:glycerate kinase
MTGEGRMDATSWAGKVVGAMLQRTGSLNLPVVVVAGAVDTTTSLPSWAGDVTVADLSARFGIARAMEDAEGCVTETVAEILGSRWG